MRDCTVHRKTKETDIKVKINLDGSGKSSIETGIEFLNHMLASMAKHGRFDLEVTATGDLKHHIVEDVAICLGLAVDKALGEKKDIARIGTAVVPMDDALVLVAVDLSGRAYSDISLKAKARKIEDISADLLEHFLDTFAKNGRFNLHVIVLKGKNDHHKIEAAFKALGVALREAVKQIGGGIPSTKGVL
ncbi:MAG: imidazoleglycerol-phosphate dehydratase HisB [Candidatus Hadarchaeales archaeon]